MAPLPPRSSLLPPGTVGGRGGLGRGIPWGLWAQGATLVHQARACGPLHPVGCALDLPLGLGLLWGLLFLAALTSGSSRSSTPGGGLSSSWYGCLVDRSLEGRLLTAMASSDPSMA